MSINNKRSYTEYTVVQPTTDFAIGFDDFDEGSKDNILVTLNGVLVESLGYAAIRKNESTVTITPAITEGTVRLTRETDIDEPFHKFTAGALFSAKSMDENFQQVRHSQQEVRDGFVFLEYNTNGIVQASKEATAQAKVATVEATASAIRAESAADTAVQAVGSLQGVVDAATTATTNANAAIATATTAASQATAATTSAQNATQAANTAKQEATIAAANANAATVDTLAATGRANEAADVVADLVVGKVRAQDVSTSGGRTQEEVNKRTAYKYNTVADMVADTKLATGSVVATVGYNSPNDKGGAKYIISGTATNYSIPLNNGLHAIFNDTFDIRKFGIVDDPTFTKVQDSNLTRMCRYADKYSYVVDFHNFSIKTPQTLFYPTGRGLQYRGLGFNKIHDIRNLKMSHNVGTINQVEGLTHIMIKFLSYDDIVGELRFSNITLDGSIQNYSTTVGESDAGFNGILIETHGLENTLWQQSNHRIFPLDIYFDNIKFPTPCMSYNISASAFKSRRITAKNLRGDVVGLMSFVYADEIDISDVDGVYRKDLHKAGRGLVRSCVHIEPEMGESGKANIKKLSVSSIKFKDNEGNDALGFFSYIRGQLDISNASFSDIDSALRLDVSPSKGSKVTNLNISNVNRISLLCRAVNITIDKIKSQNWYTNNITNDGVFEYHTFNYLVVDEKLAISNTEFVGNAVAPDACFQGGQLSVSKSKFKGYGNQNIVFKAPTGFNEVEFEDCLYSLEQSKIYSGAASEVIIKKGRFVDYSTNFLDITNTSNAARVIFDSVVCDGILKDLVTSTTTTYVDLMNMRLNQSLDNMLTMVFRLRASGLFSKGFTATTPANTTVPAKSIISFNIDMPFRLSYGDFKIIYPEQNGCIFTAHTSDDLAALSVLKVYVQNTTGSHVNISGKPFSVMFSYANST